MDPNTWCHERPSAASTGQVVPVFVPLYTGIDEQDDIISVGNCHNRSLQPTRTPLLVMMEWHTKNRGNNQVMDLVFSYLDSMRVRRLLLDFFAFILHPVQLRLQQGHQLVRHVVHSLFQYLEERR